MSFLSKLFGKKQPVSPAAQKLHNVITTMCANPSSDSDKETHAASLYELLATSSIPKDVADLFVDVTTYSAQSSVNMATLSVNISVSSTESMDALEKLCSNKEQVVDNLLHRIAKMSDTTFSQDLAVHHHDGVRSTGKTKTTTRSVSFQSQRNMARAELNKRGSPKYNIMHYLPTSSDAPSQQAVTPS